LGFGLPAYWGWFGIPLQIKFGLVYLANLDGVFYLSLPSRVEIGSASMRVWFGLSPEGMGLVCLQEG
jgi:hypothetical protein